MYTEFSIIILSNDLEIIISEKIGFCHNRYLKYGGNEDLPTFTNLYHIEYQ